MATIALAAKRYDGANGSAVFSGTVPFAPGVLFASDVPNMLLMDGSTEVGVTKTALYPQHLDGSIKAVKIDAILSINTGSTLALTLVTGVVPTKPGPGYTDITAAWMKSPRLIACTEAIYLCNSQIAPWPLVPWNHPSLPAAWQQFLSADFDGTDPNFPAYGNMRPYVIADTNDPYGDTATYDSLACVYQRYLTSGDIDKLADAHLLAQRRGAYTGAPNWFYNLGYTQNIPNNMYPSGWQTYDADWAGDAWYPAATAGTPFPCNPENFSPHYVDAAGTNLQPFGTTEWNSGFHHDMWFCYMLSGWRSALGCLITYGVGSLYGAFLSGGSATNFGAPTISQPGLTFGCDGYGGRFTFRLIEEPAVYHAMFCLPMALHDQIGKNLHAPGWATGAQKYRDYVKAKLFDSWEAWSLRYDPSHYLHGIWGFCPPGNGGVTTNNGPAGAGFAGLSGTGLHPYPAFDLFLWFTVCLSAHLRIVPDDRVPAQLEKVAALTLGNCRPYPNPAWRSGRSLYTSPYWIADPALVVGALETRDPATIPDPPTDNWAYTASTFYTPTMNLALLAYGWQKTGNSAYLDVIDKHATNEAFVYNTNLGSAGASWKQLGELYLTAFLAAAYRAGVQDAIPQGVGTTITIPTIYETDTPITITPTGGAVANFIFNIAKGRWAELYNRVKLADPANAAIVIVVLKASGLESKDVLQDRATLADVLTAGSTAEVTNSGYARKVITGATLGSLSPDNTTDRMYNDMPDQTWSTVAAGDQWGQLLICYDSDTTSGTDASIVPMHCYDFIKSPDGTDITAQVASGGFAYAA